MLWFGLALILLQRLATNSVQAHDPQLTAQFLLASNTEIVQSNTLLNPESIVKTYNYNEVLDFKAGRAVVTKQNVIYYVQFDAKGEIAREVELGIRPDLVLAMAHQLLLNSDNAYFAYVIPLRGIRLFQISADSKVLEKYFPINEFFSLYSDNELFISQNKLYIPDGGLKLYAIDLSAFTLATETMAIEGCHKNNWEMSHNRNDLFILKSGTEICVRNFTTGKVFSKFDVSAGSWFRLIPETNLVIVEDWQTLNNFPSSTGNLTIYSLDKGQELSKVDLSANSDFIAERTGSPGGYSLIGADYVFTELNQLYLFSRAGRHIFVLKLDQEFRVVGFEQVSDFHFGKASRINY